MSKKLKTSFIFLGCIILLLVIGTAFLYQLFHFKLQMALGYISVYKTNLTITLLTPFLSGIVICLASLFLVKKIDYVHTIFENNGYKVIRAIFGVVGFIFGLTIGQINPTDWLLFFNHQLFGKTDPINHLDYSFYVYQLPVIQSLLGKMIGIIFYFIVIKGIVAVITYLFKDHKQINISKAGQIISIIDAAGDKKQIHNPKAIQSISRLVGLLFLTFAAGNLLSRYTILFNAQEGNFLYGPGFADTHFTIPISISINSLLLLFISMMFFVFSFKLGRVKTSKADRHKHRIRHCDKPPLISGQIRD